MFLAVVELSFYLWIQDSLESPEEGRLPDAKQGMHAYKVSAALIQKLRFSLFFLGYFFISVLKEDEQIIILISFNVVMVCFFDFGAGASHLKDIFYRMGLSDKDIVALSGAHTLVAF